MIYYEKPLLFGSLLLIAFRTPSVCLRALTRIFWDDIIYALSASYVPDLSIQLPCLFLHPSAWFDVIARCGAERVSLTYSLEGYTYIEVKLLGTWAKAAKLCWNSQKTLSYIQSNQILWTIETANFTKIKDIYVQLVAPTFRSLKTISKTRGPNTKSRKSHFKKNFEKTQLNTNIRTEVAKSGQVVGARYKSLRKRSGAD